MTPYPFTKEPPKETFVTAPAGSASRRVELPGFRDSEQTEPSTFEQKAQELGLKPDKYATSKKLREWAKKNYMTKYVPEQLLKAWGCRIVQGYYFAKPLPVGDVEALLRSGTITPTFGPR